MTINRPDPIVQHPGEGSTSKEAILLAVQRIRERNLGGKSVVLFAQGQGPQPDEAKIVEVGMRAGLLLVREPLQQILFASAKAGLPAFQAEEVEGVSRCVVRDLTAEQIAGLVDAVFRDVCGIQPLAGDADYAFAAELG